MTKQDLVFKIQTKQPFEFQFNNKTYNLTFDVDENGNTIIVFGLLYEGVKYKSFGELMNVLRCITPYLTNSAFSSPGIIENTLFCSPNLRCV